MDEIKLQNQTIYNKEDYLRQDLSIIILNFNSLLFNLIKQMQNSIMLKDFIKKIRCCKTQAEQRAEVQKQMAIIREYFSKNDTKFQLRNITKLLFINMMGNHTDFGQIQCLNIISQNSFTQKRIGYLGLTQLFHEKSQLLMMATNTLRKDLTSTVTFNKQFPHIIGMALCILSEICTNQVSRQLAPQVLKLCSNTNSYIRKKALLCSTKILKRCKDHIDSYLPKIQNLIEDKNNGVLLGLFALIEVIIGLDQSYAKKLVIFIPKMVLLFNKARILKSTLSISQSQYQPGASDPFLQCQILKLFRIILKYEPRYIRQITDVLFIVNDTFNNDNLCSNKQCVNAILLQLTKTIISIESSNVLRNIAIELMGKFLYTKDANSKYLALYILTAMSTYDQSQIQKYKSLIIQCMQENDILIKIMALDLIFIISNSDNVVLIVKQLLNILLSCNDEQFIPQLATKVFLFNQICIIVDKHAPNRRWHFDIILKILIIAGQFVEYSTTDSLINLICSTPQLHRYAIIKLFYSSCQYMQNQGLNYVTLFILGQFNQVLLEDLSQSKINQQHILNMIQNIINRSSSSSNIKEYALTALFKIFYKAQNKKRIKAIISSFQSSNQYQIQKRACQYSKLMEDIWTNDLAEIFIPLPSTSAIQNDLSNIPIGDIDLQMSQFKEIRLPEKIDYSNKEKKKKLESIQKKIKPELIQNQTQQKNQKIKKQPNQINQNKYQKKKTIDIFELDQVKQVVAPPKQQEQIKKTKQFNFFDDDQYQSTNLPSVITNQSQSNPLPIYTDSSINNHSNIQLTNPVSLNQIPSNQNEPIIQNTITVNIQNPQLIIQNKSIQDPFDLVGYDIVSNNSSNFIPYQDNTILINFQCIKQTIDLTKIKVTMKNKLNFAVYNFIMQIAVLKYLKLIYKTMSPMTLYGGQVVYTQLSIVNSMVGQKGLGCKLRIIYDLNQGHIQNQKQISQFPPGF